MSAEAASIPAAATADDDDEVDQQSDVDGKQQQQQQQQQQVKLKQQRYCSKAVGFGRNYFHAFGGMTRLDASVAPNYNDTNTTAATISSSSYDVPLMSGPTGQLTKYEWDEPPWLQDVATGSSDTDLDELKQVAVSAQSTVYLMKKGSVYQAGTLHGRIYHDPEPILIPLPLKCVEIAAGRHFCLARMEGGLATVSWGAGHFGQLGVGGGNVAGSDASSSSSIDGQITFTPQPVIIERLLPHVIGSPIQQIACGDWHALALSKSGRIWAFGSNRTLQCGRKPNIKGGGGVAVSQAPTLTAPLPVPLEGDATYIAAGRSHSLAVVNGQVYAFGGSLHGQCGNSVRRTGVAPPKKVEGLTDLTVSQVAAGGNHSLALTTGGRVFTWGSGNEGELGVGQAIPAQVKPRLMGDLDFVAIEAGQEWKTQQKYTTGSSNSGGSKLSPLPDLPKIIKVFAGPMYSAALSSSGHLYSWGINDIGQLGIPTPPNLPFKDNYVSLPPRTSTIRDLSVRTFDSNHNVLLPTRVDAVKDLYVRDVACGPNHMCLIGEDRSFNQTRLPVGRTLYEVQEEQRLRKLYRARNSLISKITQSQQEKDDAHPEDGGVTEGTTTQTEGEENESSEQLQLIPPSPPPGKSKMITTPAGGGGGVTASIAILPPETPTGASVSTSTDIATTPATILSDPEPLTPSTDLDGSVAAATTLDFNNKDEEVTAAAAAAPPPPPAAAVDVVADLKTPKNNPGKRRRFSLPKMLRKLTGKSSSSKDNRHNSFSNLNSDSTLPAAASTPSTTTATAAPTAQLGRGSSNRGIRRNKRNSL